MSTNQEIYNLKKDTNKYFWLLLIYSLLPGIYKIVDNQLLMLGSIPIIIIFFSLSKGNIRIYKYDALFLFFIFYIILQSIFWFFFPITNKIGLMMGIFMNVIPMTGFLISKSINIDAFSKAMLKVVLIHCVIGIILYPVFGITNNSLFIVKTLREGVAIGRMSSVSGSLGFGNLLMVGFIISFFTDRRYLLPIGACLVLSLQRSAWLGGLFVILLYLFSLIKRGNLLKTLKFVTIFTGIGLIIFFITSNYIDIDFGYLIARFNSADSAGSERFGQWTNGLNNFKNFPLGTGVGQVGQFASRYDEAQSIFNKVPDGDYFRILSEYGIVGFLFYLYIVTAFFFSVFFINLKLKNNLLILSLIGGELIQMIGSNISEFYFTNFIYWMIFGYFFTILGDNYSLKTTNKKKKNDISLYSNI